MQPRDRLRTFDRSLIRKPVRSAAVWQGSRWRLVAVPADFDGLNLSYHLHPENWGQGYASELVTEALRTAFGPLQADRVIGLVRAANPASRRVLERCGFTFEKR